jgi:predicted nucleic acid-binding protein
MTTESAASSGIQRPFACVVDANVAMRVFITQPMSDLADTLFSYLDTNTRAMGYVPEFFYAECANALWQYVRQARYPIQTARENMRDLMNLPLQPVPATELLPQAFEITLKYSIAAYDACYVELAHQIEAPMITCDEKLLRALAHSPFDVRLLSTIGDLLT